ncbi:hypothetical protein KI387_023226, partial [Taxus chinensis]
MKAITWFLVALLVLQHDVGTGYGQLNYYFYRDTCPNLEKIVFNVVRSAVINETRMAASLLRLHFHDCFINGCEGSILLDDTNSTIGEKTAAPNHNSARGFEVIDDIKTAVENSCKAIVSCSDILSLAARDSVYLSGGPYWPISLGRRDGKTASKSAANAKMPSPFESVDSIINKFQAVGLSVQDVVVLSVFGIKILHTKIISRNTIILAMYLSMGLSVSLLVDMNWFSNFVTARSYIEKCVARSGAHTIGAAHCNTFRSRLFNFRSTSSPDPTIERSFLATLQSVCPDGSNNPNTLTSLDPVTQDRFDNAYFRNLQNNKGLLQSDQAMFSNPNASTVPYVNYYSNYPYAFINDFRVSMMKLANLSILTGSNGEIRKNC